MENDIACCALCGAPIVQLSDISLPQPREWPSWMIEFRALFAIKDSYEAQISEKGYSKDDAFHIEEVPGSSRLTGVYLNRGHGFGKRWYSIPNIIEETYDTCWGFGFHVGCWDMLNLVNRNSTPSIQSTFDVLRSFPVDAIGGSSSALNFGHNYGPWAYADTLNSLFLGENLHYLTYNEDVSHTHWSSMTWLDPSSLPDIRQFLSKNVEFSAAETALNSKIILPIRHSFVATDKLCSLPTETLLAILELLPSPDVLNVKRASRTLASISLPNSFWKSRFSNGHEFDFLFEVLQHKVYDTPINYKLLYTFVQSLMEQSTIVNRKRVWKLAKELRCLSDHAKSSNRYGQPSQSIFEPLAAKDTKSWHSNKNQKQIAASGTTSNAGYQAIFYRTTAIPAIISKAFVITLGVYGKRYVTGIRFQSDGDRSYEVGYVSTDSEIAMSLQEFSLYGFTIAADFAGIRGVSLISADEESDWVGEHAGIPLQRLVFYPATAVKFLKAGLDALRIYSLSISDDQTYPEENLSPRDAFVWYPDIPPPSLSFLGLVQYGNQTLRPVLWQLMITMEDDLLPCCTQLRAVIDDEKSSIRYLDVTTTKEEKPKRFGIQGTITIPTREVVLDIDASKGEFLEGLEIMYEERMLQGFKLFTNHGQVARFPEEDVLYMEKIKIWQPEKYFPKQSRIVGFCARVRENAGFESFGIITKPLPDIERSA